MDLPLLAINAADELERLRLKKKTNLKSTKELSILIKESFQKKLNYHLVFSNAYFSTYYKEISPSPKKNSRYIKEISKKLESPSNLENKELKDLVDFCANLSDYSSLHQDYLESLKGPCFG